MKLYRAYKCQLTELNFTKSIVILIVKIEKNNCGRLENLESMLNIYKFSGNC